MHVLECIGTFYESTCRVDDPVSLLRVFRNHVLSRGAFTSEVWPQVLPWCLSGSTDLQFRPGQLTLKRRHIKPAVSLCWVCLAEEENLKHALMDCLNARRFWGEAQTRFDFLLPNLFSAEVRAKIYHRKSVMWSIWHSRNR